MILARLLEYELVATLFSAITIYFRFWVVARCDVVMFWWVALRRNRLFCGGASHVIVGSIPHTTVSNKLHRALEHIHLVRRYAFGSCFDIRCRRYSHFRQRKHYTLQPVDLGGREHRLQQSPKTLILQLGARATKEENNAKYGEVRE